ncbi:MAG: hypothetical protein WEE89_09355 [Gemmatimonadota bacterium]
MKRPSIMFVETRIFTQRIIGSGLERSLRDLQLLLVNQPDAGDLDPGTGGLRKVRMPDPSRGKGKRGGARVHYLWLPEVSVVYFLFVYTKEEARRLTPGQKRELRAVVDAIKKEWTGED